MKSTITLLKNMTPLLAGMLAVAGCAAEPSVAEPGAATIDQALSTVDAARGAARRLQAPAGCTEIQAGAFHNGVALTPTQYAASPTYRTTITSLGDPAISDVLAIRLDAATAPGVYSLAGANANTFSCAQCVIANADQQASHLFVADAGSVLVAAKLNPQQSIGALAGVTLREATVAAPTSGPYKGSAIVPGGACYWIRFATWNTVRPFACDPAQDSITSHLPGFTCVADDYAADDGTLERTTGTKRQGDACAYTAATSSAPATSDCATGYACSDLFSDTRACLQTCDFLAADPGCGSGRVCGVYGVCIEQSTLEELGFAFDPAALGEACASDYTEFCGSDGARGMCLAISGPGTARCYPYARARSDCGPGEELGFISYPLADGGYDRSYGFCYPR